MIISHRSLRNHLSAALLVALLTGGTASGVANAQSFVLAQAQPNSKRPKRLGAFKTSRDEDDKNATKTSRSSKSKSNSNSKANTKKGADDGKAEGDETKAGSKSSGGVQGVIALVRQYAVWIVIGLVAVICGVVLWLFLSRSGSTGEDAFAELDEDDDVPMRSGSTRGGSSSGYSSTRISAREVNDRLAGVDESEIETDKEYALVVDGDALVGDAPEDTTDLHGLVEGGKFDEAYSLYLSRVKADASRRFDGEMETRLSEHFVAEKRYDDAARVLEHHISSRSADAVASDAYFNLGYVHFFGERLAKSREYFEMYVEHADDAARVDRAKKILGVLQKSGPAS